MNPLRIERIIARAKLKDISKLEESGFYSVKCLLGEITVNDKSLKFNRGVFFQPFFTYKYLMIIDDEKETKRLCDIVSKRHQHLYLGQSSCDNFIGRIVKLVLGVK